MELNGASRCGTGGTGRQGDDVGRLNEITVVVRDGCSCGGQLDGSGDG